jgi:hypothetical protein
VKQDEKDSEQQGSCQGDSILDKFQKGSSRKSWQDMPQVKGLKELKLPVGNETEKGFGGTRENSLTLAAGTTRTLSFPRKDPQQLIQYVHAYK